MSHQWDEFSKSLAEETLPRRESLQRLGVLLAGAVLSPLGLQTAWGAPKTDPCKTFCRCSSKQQRNACLAACRACSGDTSRLCGSCGSYVCTDLNNDVRHCGACFNNCWSTARFNEETACFSGECAYQCREGAVDCDNGCAFLDSDIYNCGACGNVCPASAPDCVAGACIARTCAPYCPAGWCGGDGCGGECACPSGWVCDSNWCYAADCGGADLNSDPNNCGYCGNVCPGNAPYCNVGTCGQIRCFGGQALCGGVCREIQLDPSNCGACGVQCGFGENCAGGFCQRTE